MLVDEPTMAGPRQEVAELGALLATKLHVPRTRAGLLARPRLAGWPSEGAGGELTMVCAPAGFGKTALLAGWARGGGRPIAWLSLDAGDSDPVRFWRYVAAAIEGVHPAAGRRLAALLRPPPNQLGGCLRRE